MDIEHKKFVNTGSFYIEQNSQKVAELEYEMDRNDTLIIRHTVVSETLSGKGIGKQLVDKTVEFARKNNFKINPICSFARKVLENDSYKDILSK